MSQNSTRFTHRAYLKNSDSFSKKKKNNLLVNQLSPEKKTIGFILAYASSVRRIETTSLNPFLITLN